MKEYITFGRPTLSPEHTNAAQEVLGSGWLGRGPRVSQFEQDLKAYLKIDHALAVNSCTSALHLAAVCLDVGPDDEVVVPAMTFAATANAMLYTGAKVRFADCMPDNPCLDVANLELTPKTKAVVAVHLHGERCDMKTLSQTGVSIIEDAAHAIELKDLGRHSDAVCYSFYPSKNVTTIEGGALTSRSKEFVERARILSQHGLSGDAWTRYSSTGFKHYFVTELGYKYNMTDVQAAIGIIELKKVDEYYQKRVKLWTRYQEALADTGLMLPRKDTTDHALHLFAPRLPEEQFRVTRDEFIHALHEMGVGCGIHYLSLCEHPLYQRLMNVDKTSCPNAYRIGRETFSIPFSQYITDSQADYICESIRVLARRYRR